LGPERRIVLGVRVHATGKNLIAEIANHKVFLVREV